MKLSTIKINLRANTELKYRNPHAMLTQKIINNSGEEIGLWVIDYYTPRNRPAGWWVALRGPGYQRAKHPQYLVYIKAGLTTPNMDQVEAAIITIENMMKDQRLPLTFHKA